MMLDWNYLTNEADTSGSLARISTAIRQKRDENMIVIDAGDLVQGNNAELFIKEPVPPMMQCLNQIGYDIWVAGNHEYDFGMDTVKRLVDFFKGKTLTGNVYDPQGNRIADAWTIVERSGVKIGIIGMTTSDIQNMQTVSEGH